MFNSIFVFLDSQSSLTASKDPILGLVPSPDFTQSPSQDTYLENYQVVFK